MTLRAGDSVVITAGDYAGKKGIYKGSAGKVSGRVAIRGDTAPERTLRLTSIVKEENSSSGIREIRDEIAELTERLKVLEVKLQDLEDN